jgi:hypothetical protein
MIAIFLAGQAHDAGYSVVSRARQWGGKQALA